MGRESESERTVCQCHTIHPTQAQLEAQRATQDYQGAIEVLRAAKETIALAEQRLLEEDSRQFDSAWQEMLNHATQRVREHMLGKFKKETTVKWDTETC